MVKKMTAKGIAQHQLGSGSGMSSHQLGGYTERDQMVAGMVMEKVANALSEQSKALSAGGVLGDVGRAVSGVADIFGLGEHTLGGKKPKASKPKPKASKPKPKASKRKVGGASAMLFDEK